MATRALEEKIEEIERQLQELKRMAMEDYEQVFTRGDLRTSPETGAGIQSFKAWPASIPLPLNRQSARIVTVRSGRGRKVRICGGERCPAAT
jgi:hypothetical protein